MSLKVMLTAAELSGDTLGAGLMRELRGRLGDQVAFIGAGGAGMAAEGLESLFDIGDLSIVGLVDGLLAYGRASRCARALADLAASEPPDVAVFIDSWGFSYLAARAVRLASPQTLLVKYVAPQVWATRPGRIRALAQTFDVLLSVIAFEVPLFEAAGVRTVFVGHPALDPRRERGDAVRFRARLGAGSEDTILLVLPGSRRSELRRLARPFEEALAALKQDRPGLHLVVPVAGAIADEVRAWVAGLPFRAELVQDEEGKIDAMAAATAALACSGTVTSELAAAGCPMVVAYRVGPVTYEVARRIIRTDHVTLFNIAAGETIAPELIQGDCTGPRLAEALAPLLDDPEARARQAEAQSAALGLLGRGVGPPQELAAEAVIAAAAQPR